MTQAEELAALETQYAAWIAAGMSQSYSLNGRSVSRVDMLRVASRIDLLRAAVDRNASGGFFAAQFRPDT